MVLVIPTFEAISCLSGLVIVSIVVRLPACPTYHSFAVTTHLAIFGALFGMAPLLAPVILPFPFLLILLLVKDYLL